jgi:outer membrane protein OmpA-like peptidoglycan-associated protein
MPETGMVQWTVNGENISQARTFEFGSTGRQPGSYRVGLKATATGYKDVLADTVITILAYSPPTGTLSSSPAEILVGEKATLTPSFRAGQCGGALGPVSFTASEGTVTGDQFDSTTVRFAPPDATEQRKTINITARVTDQGGSGTAQTTVVVKQPALITAKRLPDVLFAQNSDRVNNCGKRVLLEELRNVTAADPTGRVVLVGHASEAERAADLDARRALNAAAVISAGRDVCTTFPASQILVNTAGKTDNGVAYQPQFCGGSTVPAERAGQTVSPTDANAKFRRVEVWYVPTGGAVPGSGTNAKDAATLGVARLGCPR